MKHKFMLVAIIATAIASVAYASFATTLTISGTGTATGNWDVAITGITASGQVGATDHVSTPSFAATSATFNVDLAYPGATSSYQVVIKNNGNISAKVSSITDLTTINSNAPSYLTYALSGVAANDVLAPGATDTATITVTWAASATTNPSGASKAATITFNYVQNT
jgi:hypothetical protein